MDMTRQDIAEYALDALTKAGADKAACRVSCGRKEEFNIEANKFSLLRTLFNDELYLKALCDNKKGVTVINKLDKDSIDRAVEDCIALAELATPDESEDIAEKVENKAFDQKIGGGNLDDLFSRTKEFLEYANNAFPKIMFEGIVSDFKASQSTYVNSNGVVFNNDVENYTFGTMYSAKEGEKSTSFNYCYVNLDSMAHPLIDFGMQRTLLEEAERSLDTRMVDGKFVGKVIVTPACGDMIWDTIIGNFLTDGVLVDGTSRWKDSLGKIVADSKLSMRLVPLHKSIIGGERFTADGYESRDIDLIRSGVLESFALSLYGSRKTGHPRAGNTAFGNIEVLPGDVSLENMLKGVDRGVLLNRFSGASPGPSGDVSGVAKNSFMIENGKITDALSETMLSFNIVDLLMNISGISKERCEDGMSILPWCCFDGVTISGK